MKRLGVLTILVLSVWVTGAAIDASAGETTLPPAFDSDRDGVPDVRDNCPRVANAVQSDIDADGIGDHCDPDRDGDGIFNVLDNCPQLANRRQLDGNLDGVGDHCETTKVDTVALSE